MDTWLPSTSIRVLGVRNKGNVDTRKVISGVCSALVSDLC